MEMTLIHTHFWDPVRNPPWQLRSKFCGPNNEERVSSNTVLKASRSHLLREFWSFKLATSLPSPPFEGYSSYCGTSGALSALDFGQLFVGDHQDVTNAASRCKFAPLIQFGDFQDGSENGM